MKGISELISVKAGATQGEPLSGATFNLNTNAIVAKLQDNSYV